MKTLTITLTIIQHDSGEVGGTLEVERSYPVPGEPAHLLGSVMAGLYPGHLVEWLNRNLESTINHQLSHFVGVAYEARPLLCRVADVTSESSPAPARPEGVARHADLSPHCARRGLGTGPCTPGTLRPGGGTLAADAGHETP